MEVIRNIRGLKQSTTNIRQRKGLNEIEICFNCKKEFKKYQVDIEHEIPVCIGGDVELFRILCKECHNEKDRIDKIIIHCFLKLNLLEKLRPNEYLIKPNKEFLIEIYKKLYAEVGGHL